MAFVNVIVRVRPVLSRDSTTTSNVQIINRNPDVLLLTDRTQSYCFDHIFNDDVDQETVYNSTVKPLIERVKDGYNCTVLAYGQTGTGKTYTMGTNPNGTDPGIIPRTLVEFFEESEEREVDISVSFIEIYNEKVYDLLNRSNKDALPVKGFNAYGCTIRRVFDSDEASKLLEFGNKNRHTAKTNQNSDSSRSHAIFTIYCKSNNARSAKLNLVDLAGSESLKKTGNQGNTLFEGININKGLLCIGQVMTALSTNAAHVPYRQSTLTTILQESLSKKNYITLISCINGNPEDVAETIQTLEFAQRVKHTETCPEVNNTVDKFIKTNPGMFRTQTPFKRPLATPAKYKATPMAKSRRYMPQSTPFCPNGNSTTLSAIDMSTIANAENQTIHFSPHFRKYMEEMQENLKSHFDTVLRQRKRRSSIRTQVEKENTLLQLDGMAAHVSMLVRQEMAQMAAESQLPSTSSPIEAPINRKLFDNQDGAQHLDEPLPLNELSSFNFKRPNLPVPVIKLVQTKTVQIKDSPIKVRRSVRLSLKIPCTNRDDEKVPKIAREIKATRPALRRSTRLSVLPTRKSQKLQLKQTHSTESLKILNTGNSKAIEKFQTIGPKTAEQIILYRKLNGKFNTLSDLRQIPGWTLKKYQRFLDQNLL